MKVHYTHPYITNPVHKITIDLVGLGGTGSQVLNSLARINVALLGLNHPGIHVRAWDADEITTANMGRQLFSPADVGLNKALVLVTRVNRFFGFDWQAMTRNYNGAQTSNILITCVDTAAARVQIGTVMGTKAHRSVAPTDQPYYWLDLGNMQKTGQVIIGTLDTIPQPKTEHKTTRVLPTVIKKFPQLKKLKEEKQGPSCSLAEALEKQDLFINSTLAQFGCNIIWKLIREGQLQYQGCYVNLETLSVNPIKIN